MLISILHIHKIFKWIGENWDHYKFFNRFIPELEKVKLIVSK